MYLSQREKYLGTRSFTSCEKYPSFHERINYPHVRPMGVVNTRLALQRKRDILKVRQPFEFSEFDIVAVGVRSK